MTSFEGRNYISSLSNNTDSSLSKKIISQDDGVGHLFTKEDHAGIMDLFVEKDLPDEPGATGVAGIWWRRFSVSNIDTIITCQSD
ncbi:hypothetical protein ACHAO7_012185, partial [Fusarium culmorum]